MLRELTTPNPPRNRCLLSESDRNLLNIFDWLLQRVDTRVPAASGHWHGKLESVPLAVTQSESLAFILISAADGGAGGARAAAAGGPVPGCGGRREGQSC